MNNNGYLLKILEKKHQSNEECKFISSYFDINTKEVPYLIKQFHLFRTLSKNCVNEYANFFYKINIISCELSDKHEKSTFIKIVVFFINEFMNEKKIFLINVKTEEQCNLYIQIINQLHNSKNYIYEYQNGKERCSLLKLTPKVEGFFYNLRQFIDNDIKLDNLNSLTIYNNEYDNYMNPLIEYCTKYPNTMHKMDLQLDEMYEDCKIQIDKLKKLIELNKDSLEDCLYEHIELYSECTNINTIIFNMSLPNNIPPNFDFSKITEIKIRVPTDRNRNNIIQDMIKLISKCPNLEALYLKTKHVYFKSSELLPIIMNINCPKLKILHCKVLKNNYDMDFDPILERFPKLEELWVCYSNRNIYSYTLMSVLPIFLSSDIAEIDNSNLLRLYNNKRKNDKYCDIHWSAGGNSNIFNYCKYHPQIIKEIHCLNSETLLHLSTLPVQIEHVGYISVSTRKHALQMRYIKKLELLEIYNKIQDMSTEELKELIIKTKPSVIHNKSEDSYLPFLIDLFDEISELQFIFHKDYTEIITRD